MKNEHNPFENALEQLTNAKKYLDLPAGIWEIFENAQREVAVNFPVKMDDGHIEVFHGYRVQHNNLFGPYKGGIRFHPVVNLDEVRALAFWMMMKNAIVNIPMGGGKGGVIVDPKTVSEGELERVTRGFIDAIAPVIGPYSDVPGPDMGTPPKVMGWMADEFGKAISSAKERKLSENEVLATFTGKPVGRGGSEGREEATGRGGLYVLHATIDKLRSISEKTHPIHKKQLTIAVQGFGNLGYHFARFAQNEGFKVIAISDSKNGIYVPEGLNPVHVGECKQKTGTLAKCFCTDEGCDIRKGKLITNEELLELPVDILVPAAIEDVLTGENAHKVKASVVFEMANGPTTPEADEILLKKNIWVIPDVLANGGGVTVSSFEWEQNLKNEHWSATEVNGKLKEKMESAFTAVWQEAQSLKTNMRIAAYVTALKRLAEKIH